MNKKLIIYFYIVTGLFSQQIDTVWIRGYDSPEMTADYGSSITIDNTGTNVYVAGSSGKKRLLIKYSSNGDLKWVKYEPAVYSDEGDPIGLTYWNGKIYFTVSMTYQNIYYDKQIWTFCYDTSGSKLWGQNFGDMYDCDFPVNLFIDKQGYLYVAGTSCFDTTAEDFILLKYDSNNGNMIWYKRYWSVYDYVLDMALDATISYDSNYIYIGGISEKPNEYREYRIVKYSTAGSLIFSVSRPIQDPYNSTLKIFPDYSDNLYALFINYSIGQYESSSVSKYNPNGNLIYQIVLPESLKVNSIFVDSENNFYIIGSVFNYNNNTWDAFLRKYSSQGTMLFEKTFDLGMNEENLIIKSFNNSLLILCKSDPGVFFLRYSYDGILLNTSNFFLSQYKIEDFVKSQLNNNVYSIGTVPPNDYEWPSDIVLVKYEVP